MSNLVKPIKNLCSEVSVEITPLGWIQLCYLGKTDEEIKKFTKEQLMTKPWRDKLYIVLVKDFEDSLCDLFRAGDLWINDKLNDYYEDFKYNKPFKENATTRRLEILILNHYLEKEIKEKEQLANKVRLKI